MMASKDSCRSWALRGCGAIRVRVCLLSCEVRSICQPVASLMQGNHEGLHSMCITQEGALLGVVLLRVVLATRNREIGI